MSKSIRTEIVINAPKEKVWDILTNFPAYANWNPFIIHIAGALKTGSKVSVHMLANGKKYKFKPKLLKVIPNQYFDWMGSMLVKGIFDGHHYFEIEEITPNQVNLRQGENFSGILSNMFL